MSAAIEHETAEARGEAYRLFAWLALREVDEELVGLLGQSRLLGPAFQESGGTAALRSLRVDYARTFLMAASPYESVYLDESGMLNSGPASAMLEHYREAGWEPNELTSVGAPDHLGLELLFMAHLIDRRAAALAIGNRGAAQGFVEAQEELLANHLLRWAPIFGAALADVAASPFYRAYGDALGGLLLRDYEGLGRE